MDKFEFAGRCESIDSFEKVEVGKNGTEFGSLNNGSLQRGNVRAERTFRSYANCDKILTFTKVSITSTAALPTTGMYSHTDSKQQTG